MRLKFLRSSDVLEEDNERKVVEVNVIEDIIDICKTYGVKENNHEVIIGVKDSEWYLEVYDSYRE